MPSIADASITLRANADKLRPGFERAERELEKHKREQTKKLGDIAQAGEKIGGAFARAGGVSSAFERLASDTNTFKASVDVAAQSVGNLVNSINLAKATGGSLMSGLGFGLAGLAVGAGGALLNTIVERLNRTESPETAARRTVLRRRADTLTAFAERERGAAGSLESRGEDSERVSLRAAERELERLRAAARIPVPGGTTSLAMGRGATMPMMDDPRLAPEIAEATAAVERHRRAVERIAEARRREREEVERIHDLDRMRRDRDLGRAARESLRSPMEAARDAAREELRALMLAESRTPGAVGADVLRRRADALAGGLGGDRPIGPAGLEAGSVEATRAINAFATGGREERGERLLEEVRDAIRADADRAAAALVASPIGSSITAIAEAARRLFGI